MSPSLSSPIPNPRRLALGNFFAKEPANTWSQKYWPLPGWACTKRKLIFQTYISRLLWYTLGVILENLSFLMCYICTVDGFIEILQYWMGSLSYYLTRVLYVPTWCRSSLIGNISKSGGREENRQFLLITGVFFHYNGLLSLVSVAFNIYIYIISTPLKMRKGSSN